MRTVQIGNHSFDECFMNLRWYTNSVRIGQGGSILFRSLGIDFIHVQVDMHVKSEHIVRDVLTFKRISSHTNLEKEVPKRIKRPKNQEPGSQASETTCKFVQI